MNHTFTRLLATSMLAVASASAFAQANDWIIPPSTRINFSSGSASISTLSGSSAISGCGAGYAYMWNQQASTVSDASGNGMAFVNSCGIYNLSGTAIGSGTGAGYQNVFAVPGLCKTYYTLQWESVWGPPHGNALILRVLDATNPAAITETSSTGIINDGYMHSGGAIAVAPLAADGSRKIYFGDYDSIKTFTIGANGGIGSVTRLCGLPYPLETRTAMKVTPDGKKLLLISGTPKLYDIAANSFMDVTGLGISMTVSGLEYVPYGTDDRIYVSYHKWDGFTTTAGLGYVNLSAPTTLIDALPGVSTPTKFAYGYSQIERAKDGKLYFAYHNNYASHYLVSGDAGSLSSLDPATGTLAAVLNGGSPIYVYSQNSNWNYLIQSQINGEVYQSYTLTTNFNLNGKSQTLFNLPTVTLCDSEAAKIYTTNTGYYSSYSVTIQKGTVSGLTFTPVGLPVTSATISASGANTTIDLDALFGASLTGYNGGLQISYTIYNGCSSATRTQKFNLVRATTLARYKATKVNSAGAYLTGGKAIQKTLPINTPMPTGATIAAFRTALGSAIGWQGASSAGIDSVNTNGTYYIKVYEVAIKYDSNKVANRVDTNGYRRVYIDTNITTGVVTRDTAPDVYYFSGTGSSSFAIPFNSQTLLFVDTVAMGSTAVNPHYLYDSTTDNQTGYDYFKEYYKFSKTQGLLDTLNKKIWCVEFTVITGQGCTVVNKSYFRIATAANLVNGVAAKGLSTSTIAIGNDEITVYPNPATSKINIDVPLDANAAALKIVNTLGQEVFYEADVIRHYKNLDISRLPAGVYIYQLTIDGKDYHGRLLKQ